MQSEFYVVVQFMLPSSEFTYGYAVLIPASIPQGHPHARDSVR